MSQEPPPKPSFFTQFDVSHDPKDESEPPAGSAAEQTHLLREILSSQDRQNELLEELVSQLGASQRQRADELGQWRQANPHLARRCRHAAEAMSKVQTEFLASLTEEIGENYETLLGGEFMLNEFVDRVGPRLAHLNGVLQVLAQLSSTPGTPKTHNSP